MELFLYANIIGWNCWENECHDFIYIKNEIAIKVD